MNFLKSIVNLSFYNINNDKYNKYLNNLEKIQKIKYIKRYFQNKNIETNLFIKICNYLYGDIIEINFNKNYFYLFKDNCNLSCKINDFLIIYNNTGKYTFNIPIKYNKKFFYVIYNYLLYNTEDSIENILYNPKSLIYLKYKDDFNNKIILNLNYYELKELKEYISYFKMKVLDFKISMIIDIIDLSFKYPNIRNKNEKIIKFL